MAIALVTSVQAGSADNHSNFNTATVTTTGATLFVGAVHEYDPGRTGGALIADSATSTWNPLTLYVEGGTSTQVRLFWAIPASVGAGHYFTYNGISGEITYAVLSVLVFSGTHASAPYGVENGAEAVTAALQPGSVSPSEDGMVIVTANASEGAAISSITGGGGGYTIAQNMASSGVHIAGAIAYRIQTTATASNPTWNLSGADNHSAAIATFKAAAGGGASSVVLVDGGGLVDAGRLVNSDALVGG